MGLITETNAQYYSGQQSFVANGMQSAFQCTFNTDLLDTVFGVSNTNFSVTLNGAEVNQDDYTLVYPNIVQFEFLPAEDDIIVVSLSQPATHNNYGSYEYISLVDVINNFIVAYVGTDKLIPRVKRQDVVFHAKRGLQEFSYDTLKSIKSQELTVPPSLSVIIPQDYVNYVKVSWVDEAGIQRIIYPTNNLTMSPTELPLQDDEGVPTHDNLEANLLAAQSLAEERWKVENIKDINGNLEDDSTFVYSYDWWKLNYGRRYGLEPQYAQKNGWFNINRRENKFCFSSNIANKLIILEYISDGLAYDEDMKIPKMAEQAMYMHIAYSILSTRSNVPEYIVQRFKKDRSAQLRNAKIRLQNIKLDEIVQVFRGKSKWIKN
tara:strand:+ start:26978 stop:28108 length:1131 start_codon:yes stop_codon:yes gene_type:complete